MCSYTMRHGAFYENKFEMVANRTDVLLALALQNMKVNVNILEDYRLNILLQLSPKYCC